jgi:hypothetical protein
MKTGRLVTILAIAGLSFVFASCSETLTSVEDSTELSAVEKSSEVAALCGTCDFSGTLTEAEVAGLMEMREEEKLAREVYLFLYEKFEYRVFSNIAKSENAHASAVLYLINGYGLTDPTPVAATEFSNPLFTDLFKQLTEKGSESLVEALKTGAFIEEYDIADLQRLLEGTQSENIKRVYGNLLSASKIHLRAFANSLKLQGETYTPTVISVDEYTEILGESGFAGNTGNTTTPGTCDGTGPNN